MESWLKESEEDATKAEEYLDKKREKKAVVNRGSSSDLRAGEEAITSYYIILGKQRIFYVLLHIFEVEINVFSIMKFI